jgi:hypothetical protein
MGIRPLSFTRNLGGLGTVYRAIRKGYSPGVTVAAFKKRCGLGPDIAHVVTEFFLCAIVRDGQEYILEDRLIEETLRQPHLTANLKRLYLLALNLNIPGERIRDDQRTSCELQNVVVRAHLYVNDGWYTDRFEKDHSLQPFVHSVGEFRTAETVRKWVNNYSYIIDQCEFIDTRAGRRETFADYWGPAALHLFFERIAGVYQVADCGALVRAAYDRELHKILGVPKAWLDTRLEGAADMFVADELYVFEAEEEGTQHRREAARSLSPPPPGAPAPRRASTIQKLIRRGDNKRFLYGAYEGKCQVSGVILRLQTGDFTIDCSHIRPLAPPHSGDDDVRNMLCLAPTMHRLFDHGCILIDPRDFSIKLLHGNTQLPHLEKLLVHPEHRLNRDNLEYYKSQILRL